MKWEKSDLQMGEELNLPNELFFTKERLIRSRYIGETDSGIVAECEFLPVFESDQDYCYRVFISWASIYCGAKVVTSGNRTIRAKMKENYDG